MKTETLLWILGATVVLSLVFPPLFGILLFANTVIILYWLLTGRGGGGGSSGFEEYDPMGPGDDGGD